MQNETRKELLKRLPMAARMKATKYAHKDGVLNDKVSYYRVLLGAFDWSETPQGFDYWNKLSVQYYERS